MFHKHKGMKDGRLNKCSSCVVKDTADWRIKNPEARKAEHQRTYVSKRKEPIKGRKTTSLNYAHKRRMLTTKIMLTELDDLVFTEAVDVRERRNKSTGFDWHVDHIVPINNKAACGLHNAFNLQVVPASWNIRKQASNMKTFFISGY